MGSTIGEGTFGKVKEAIHILTGEKVAIKILEKRRIKEVADVERVSREIHILKVLRHPNIIQLYEVSLLICINNVSYKRSLKRRRSCFLSWSMPVGVNYLITSSRNKR
jgi:serine/threonine protein kinase